MVTHSYGYNDTHGDLRVGADNRSSGGNFRPNLPVSTNK